MSKYDFGYLLQENTTNKWAYEQIEEGAKVLELGSSVGCLTFNLSQNKQCNVDIIEIDEESGKRASEYANKALLGNELGNLNSDCWYEELRDNRYEYIVALDVLEHLENPERVLGLLKGMLTENGKVILSIPNIAHNAIVLELFNNKFSYSDLGLLDRTHIHFFAYESIQQMIEENGLYVSVLDAIKKDVLETEFTNSYKDVPTSVEGFLRTRKYGDIYQYLLVLERKPGKLNDSVGNGIVNTTNNEAKILVDGLLKNQIVYQHTLGEVNFDVDLSNFEGAKSIRFVPIERDAIITNLEVVGIDNEGNKIKLLSNWTTGISINEKTYILCDGKYEINYLLPKKCKMLCVSCTYTFTDKNIFALFASINSEMVNRENEVEKQKKKVKEQKKKVEEHKKEIEEHKKEIEEHKKEIEEQIQIIKELNRSLELKENIIKGQNDELQEIKNTWLYKALHHLILQKKKGS